MKYISASEATKKWGVSTQRIQYRQGRIKGLLR